MLKRIAVEHVRLGMYIHEFCGSWMEHPFWRPAFLLDDARDLRRILDGGIRELWIDTSQGLDAESGQVKAESDAQIERQLIHAASAPTSAVERVSMAQEIERAEKICFKSKLAVASMFKEARMGKALQAGDALPMVEEIANSVLRNPSALISLARLKTRDDYTYMHSVAVCALMVALAKQLGLDDAQIRDAGMAGLLHDVGKMAIPLAVLNKPGKLTEDEFKTVRDHPLAGHQMLVDGDGISAVVLDVCLHHHEKVDGSGYPERFSGDAISIYAKMGAVCDVYDAITSDRPYKKGWDPAEALRKMAEWSRGHFDEMIFHAFVKSVGIYPVGTVVRLESGRLGVVVDQSEKSLLTPKVRIFFSTSSQTHLRPEILDLSQAGAGDEIVGREDSEAWGKTKLRELWMSDLGAAGG